MKKNRLRELLKAGKPTIGWRINNFSKIFKHNLLTTYLYLW